MKYMTIYADPPWEQVMMPVLKRRPNTKKKLSYKTMRVDEICNLPIKDIADVGCHLWLWTTNQFLSAGFDVMQSWGFKYLAPIVWVKQSGTGNYFIHRTQTVLMGYFEKCIFPLERYKPNVIFNPNMRHSEKPQAMIDLIEQISPEPRIELFARKKRFGWDTWGNEIFNDINIG